MKRIDRLGSKGAGAHHIDNSRWPAGARRQAKRYKPVVMLKVLSGRDLEYGDFVGLTDFDEIATLQTDWGTTPFESAALPTARRILFVDHTAAIGGGEIALFNLVRRLDRRRYCPVVLLCSDGPLAEPLRKAGVETHILPLSAAVGQARKDTLGGGSLLKVRAACSAAWYVVRLARRMQKLGVELVHTNSLKADILGGLAGRLTRKPVLWHVRDRIEDDYLPRSVVKVFRLLARVVPTYVIANSAATLRTVHLLNDKHGSAIPSGIDLEQERTPGNMAVVHDGMDSRMATSDRASRGGATLIGLVGRITRWKGQHVFIAAAARVRERFPQARFQIIGAALFGENDYETEVREQVRQLGLEEAVEFTGFRSDIRQAIADLDVLVHASITGEPFGQVVIEGMAAEKPVVATNGGGVPEIVEDGQTGILVPMDDAEAMADAICRLLADPHIGREMGRRGRQRVLDHFTIDQTARKVEKLYDEILGPAGKS